MGDKLNTAEYDAKGRCVRHPAIRLRKKKLLGGWKIIIGHCPECCLDEMRRVRDEIGAEQDHNDDREERRQSRKEKKKKRGDRDRDRDRRDRDRDRDKNRGERRKNRSSQDSISEVGSEGHNRSADGSGRHRHSGADRQGQGVGGGHHGHPQGSHHRDGESEATGSTAQLSSMDGNNSVVSDQYIPRYHHHHGNGGGREYYHQQQSPPPPPPPPPSASHHHPPQHGHHRAPPPPPQRTMVLSMAFTDPQNGQRGTYTGQVNSINHKPDGKGTVYYSNGSIAEGTWMNGVLVESEDDGDGQRDGGDDNYGGEEGVYAPPRPQLARSRSQSRGPRRERTDPPRSQSRGPRSERADPPHSGGGGPPRGGRRGDSMPPPPGAMGLGGGPPPFTGNLDRLNQLGGGPRQGSHRHVDTHSVHSYNSRGSAHMNAPTGSASVQEYMPGYSGGSVMSGPVGGGGGDLYRDDYRRSDSGYQAGQQQGGQPQPFQGRSPPGNFR